MSVSIGRRRRGRSFGGSSKDPRLAKSFLWGTSVCTFAIAAPGSSRLSDEGTDIVQLIVWALIVAAVDLVPVKVWGSVSVSMSFPVTLAAGMVFLPTEAALVAFVGSFDPRELRGEVSLAKSIFNRSQVAISVLAGSAAFHSLASLSLDWPGVVFPGLVALLVDAGVNFLLVTIAVAIEGHIAPHGVLLRMFGTSPWHYLAGYLLLGLLALPLTAAFSVGGIWAVLMFIAPLVLAREMFRQTQEVARAAQQIKQKDIALVGASDEVARERKDERLALAGELHDEVLPSLFKVHLMGQVIKQDLASGKLLELDNDLPQLLLATDAAQRAVRDLLGDLRSSPLGPSGLAPTIRMLSEQLRSDGAPPVSVEADELTCSPVAQLLAYQVVREALHNAAKHAKASSIKVRIWEESQTLRVSVTDDGSGFTWSGVDTNRHFGLQIMKERVEAYGGTMFVDSRLGHGTLVVASLPGHV